MRQKYQQEADEKALEQPEESPGGFMRGLRKGAAVLGMAALPVVGAACAGNPGPESGPEASEEYVAEDYDTRTPKYEADVTLWYHGQEDDGRLHLPTAEGCQRWEVELDYHAGTRRQSDWDHVTVRGDCDGNIVYKNARDNIDQRKIRDSWFSNVDLENLARRLLTKAVTEEEQGREISMQELEEVGIAEEAAVADRL